MPNLPGPHQIMNAGAAIAALRHLGFGEGACAAAVTRAYWPARMERMTTGSLVARAGKAELWLDGGHNPAAGEAIAATLAGLPKRPTHLICGMLNTKDIGGYLRPLAGLAELLVARGDTADAVVVLEDDPSRDRAVLLRLGEVLLGRGDYEEARDVYAELRARDPADEDWLAGRRIVMLEPRRPAARRGWRPLLLERRDFAWGTSSRSRRRRWR